MKSLLRVENVRKSYGDFEALKGVSLNIEPGEIFALLGPNGAGKTTLIHCISGLIKNFSGSISVAGYDVREDYRITRQLIGLVPQELNFDPFFSVKQLLFYHGGMWGKVANREEIETLLKRFSLLDKLKSNTRWLSGGMKRRLMICKSLMHRPALLFLDEPTAGVDVELRDELWSYVRELRDKGTTVVLTTHYLEEAEQLADRIGIINEGNLLLVEERDALLHRFGKRWLEIRFRTEIPQAFLQRLSAFHPHLVSKDILRLEFEEKVLGVSDEDSVIQLVLDAAHEFKLKVVHVDGGRSRLEEIFRKMVMRNNERERVNHA